MISFHMSFIAGNMPSWCVSMPTSTIFISFLLLMNGSISISSCVISPSESVAIVGDLTTFSCNARPSNQTEGSISFVKLGSDTASGTDIFRPASYGRGNQLITRQYLADGYFLSHLDDSHSFVTLQINETQLKHGGKYFCSCLESTSKLGTANFTVLDKLSFVRSRDKPLTLGGLVELNCSVSFNGSTSFAFIDLIISDANGTQVSTERNLSLIKNVTGHHEIYYKVVADPKEEQRFTCEVKVWNKSSTEESPLRSMTSNFSLNWDRQPMPEHHSMRNASQATVSAILIPLIAVGVVAVAVIFACRKYRTRTNGSVRAQSVGQRSPTANQDIRHEDANLSIQHPLHVMPLQYSADSHNESSEREQGIVESNQTS